MGLHNSVLSDHSIILSKLNLYTTLPHTLHPLPFFRFDWSPEALARLSTKFQEPHTQLQIDLLNQRLQLPHPNVDELVASFTEILLSSTKQVVKFRKKGPPSKKQKSDRKWYDQSLRSLKKEIAALNLQNRVSPTTHRGELLRAKTNLYRRLLKSKASRFKQMLQGKMHFTTSKSPTECWNLLRDLKSNAKWDDPDQYVKLDGLTTFFRTLYNDPNLLSGSQSNPHLAFSCTDNFDENSPSPDTCYLPIEEDITSAEILSHLKKLNSGKATGLDHFSNEMLKCVGPKCLTFLTNLFNHLYQTSQFPTPWKDAYITTLHKKGSKHDPANYCPISITSCFGKLFSGILNSRLMLFMADANSVHPFLGAFTKGRRGTDHIFVANKLIDQAKQMGHPLYVAFIDLQKAYDSVSRPLLFC